MRADGSPAANLVEPDVRVHTLRCRAASAEYHGISRHSPSAMPSTKLTVSTPGSRHSSYEPQSGPRYATFRTVRTRSSVVTTGVQHSSLHRGSVTANHSVIKPPRLAGESKWLRINW